MVSKYPEMIALAKEMASRFGTRVKVESPTNTITGQQDPVSYTVYEIDVVFKINYSTRETNYMRMDYLRLLMPASNNPQPRSGDILTTPDGRKLIVETVSVVKPDGFPIVYDLSVRDG